MQSGSTLLPHHNVLSVSKVFYVMKKIKFVRLEYYYTSAFEIEIFRMNVEKEEGLL